MTTLRRRLGVPVAIALSLAAAPALAGCSVAENIVGGVVNEAQDQVGDAVDDARGQFDDALTEALGGAGISTDGELPAGFPADAVPIVGEVQGGGAGPDSSGWVARTTLSDGDTFATAATALEGAGFTGSAVDSDADSGFGNYSGDQYTVLLTVDTTDGVMTATYVVTKA